MRLGLGFLQRVALPVHSFQVRTRLLLEAVPFRPNDHVLEVGVGPAYNAYTLAPLVASWTGVDIAVDHLRTLPMAPRGDVHFVGGDASSAEFAAAQRGRFTKVVSSDALQVIPDFMGFFRMIPEVLAPGGEAFVTFPNDAKSPECLTAFGTVGQIEDALRKSGLAPVEIATVHTHPFVRWVKANGVTRPAALARALRPKRAHGGHPKERAIVNFEESRFGGSRRSGLTRYMINAYVEILELACRPVARPYFRFEPPGTVDPSRLWLRLRPIA